MSRRKRNWQRCCRVSELWRL